MLTWAQEGPEHCVLRSVAATLLGPKGWLLQVPDVVLAYYVVESPVGGLAWKGPWSFDVCGVDGTFRFAIFLFWWIAWLVPTRYWLLLCLLQGSGAPRTQGLDAVEHSERKEGASLAGHRCTTHCRHRCTIHHNDCSCWCGV